jgi:hypothetical protein
MLAEAALVEEIEVLASVDDMRLRQPPTYVKPTVVKPPTPAFHVKQAFGQSAYSGVMGFGPFPQASSIPPWREPPLTRVKTGGPPPDDARLEATGDLPTPDGRAQMRKGAAAGAVGAPPPLTPQGRLQTSQQVGMPKLTAPGPSIAQQSKPKGFGIGLPGTTKIKVSALSLPMLDTLAGGAMGASAGAVAGRALADDEHKGQGTLRGMLLGGALGAAGGHVLPRMRTAMKSGVGARDALKMVADDTRAHIHAATAPSAKATPALHMDPGVSPTQIGAKLNSEVYQKLSPHIRGALEKSPLVQSGVPPELAMQLAYMSKGKGESAVSSIARHAVGGGDTPALRLAPKLVTVGERNVPTNMATNVEAAIPTHVEVPKVAEEKTALIERLVRLGATPIPGTPKLVMNERSPSELADLQHSVSKGWNERVTKPLLSAAEPVLRRLPAGRVQSTLRRGAELAAEDPVGTLVSNAIPVPGAFPAYVGAKKGLERVIDKVAPLTRT